MPTTGSVSSPTSPPPDLGAEGGSGSGTGSGSGSGSKGLVGKSESMKVKRTTSGSKILTKSKSTGGSMKKKAEARASRVAEPAPTDTASGEMEMLTHKQNGSTVEGPEAEDQDQEEKKKEHTATIKGLWRKAFKSLKSSDQKWSVKKGASLKRRDSKEAEETEPREPKEIDPVYSLLKCAADLPRASRANKEGQAQGQGQLTPQTPGAVGAPCSGLLARHGDSSGSTSKASSPSSSGIPPLAPDGTCSHCGAVHHVDLATHNLGHDFKHFYRLTSPVKKQASADLSHT